MEKIPKVFFLFINYGTKYYIMEPNDYYKEKSRRTIKVLGMILDLSIVFLFISLVYWISTM